MLASLPLVGVVILNYNGIDDTRRALRCVAAIDRVATWPIVVDNGSEQDEAMPLRTEFPSVAVVRLDDNVGFARGANVGARRAIENGASHVLLMNSDAWMEDGNAVLERLLDVLCADRTLAAVGPLIADDNDAMALQSAGYRYSFWWPVPRANRSIAKSARCFFASGSFLLLDAERFSQLGGLDPDFFLYGEDLDFAARCRAAGYRLAIAPDVRVRHRRGGSSRIHSNRYVYTALRGNLINIRKHARWYQLPSCAVASLAISVALTCRAAAAGNYFAAGAVVAAWRDFFGGRWGGLRRGYVLEAVRRPAISDMRRSPA